MISITHIDHLVLTVQNIPVTLEFYARVLGMQAIRFGEGRTALRFGQQKINLHEVGNEYEPRAQTACPGTADLCLITETELHEAMGYVKNCEIEIILGPVERTGATGRLLSFYIRDPDNNLIEIANLITA